MSRAKSAKCKQAKDQQPHYSTVADFRLLLRAIRGGWISGMSQERWAQIDRDLAAAMENGRDCDKLAALNVVVAIKERNARIYQDQLAAVCRLIASNEFQAVIFAADGTG